jgi:predicted dehydrogenase
MNRQNDKGSSQQVDRRGFLLNTAAVSAVSYGRVQGANDRIRIAGIGCGGRCRSLLAIAQASGAQVASLADVYQPRLALALKASPDAATAADYRRVLERTDIDAVMIGSPDHWHVPMTIDALKAGKDVYVEKPVSHTIEEGEILKAAVAGSSKLVQVGYQQRSWEHFIEARKIVQSGRLGKITLVLASWYQVFLAMKDPPVLNENEIDWKAWLGSAPARQPDPWRYARWRWYWDYGGGHLTDLYSHWCDTLHWIFGLKTPLYAQAAGGKYAVDFQDCPDTINCFYEYPGKLSIVYNGTMHCSLDGGNILMRGDRAMMKLNRDGFAVYPEGVIPTERTIYPEPEIQMRSSGDGTRAHVANFLDCIRSRKQPNAPIAEAIDAANACHFGNLAYRAGKKLKFGETA